MRHSLASTLSNKMKRITLEMYIIRIPNAKPAMTRIVMRTASVTGSMFGNTFCAKWREEPLWCGKLEGTLKPLPEPISPANRPTRARRVH